MEGKLAETAPKRPLALTIGAAAATLVVILGILTGPAIVSCFNSEDGLGICLRGKMAEVGLAPPLPAPAVAEVEGEAPEAAPEADINLAVADEEAVSAEPELDVTPPADALDVATADTVIAATFGLLRAEPDGSIVIAGSGTPGSRVEVYANGELLGTVDVEASGDWVFVPDAPLAPGDLEITLGEEGKTGTAEQSFIVVLNEDRTTQPLVVASTPGQASEVLQGLETPAAATAIAAADEPASAAETTDIAVATPSEQPVAPAADAETAATAPVEQPAAEVAAATDPAPAASSEETETPDAPAMAVAQAEPAIVPETAEPDAAQVEPVTETASAVEAPVQAEAEPEPVVAAAPEAPAAETPAIAPAQLADVQPTIDAIEIEGDRTFFAGGGPDGGVIRLYVDDGFVADASVAESRWLVETGPVLNKPSQRVRIDLIQPDTGVVVARSEVDFVVDVPAAPEEQIAVADADVPATSQPVADAPVADAVSPAVAPAQPTAAPADAPAGAEVSSPEPAASPASEPAPVPGEESAPAAAAAEPVVPTMVAVSLGDPEAQRFASGKAIIRRGDNLWTIARRVYGEGLKYTTIYQANTGQIRDPDRIYPGQVFNLPVGE